jgi:hypothetical protein
VKKEMEIKVKNEQTNHKLQVVTVWYTSAGLMREEIITFRMLWDLPNNSRRMSHHKNSSPLAFIILYCSQIFFSCWWNRQIYIFKNTCTNKPHLGAYVICITRRNHFSYLGFTDEACSARQATRPLV